MEELEAQALLPKPAVIRNIEKGVTNEVKRLFLPLAFLQVHKAGQDRR